MNEETDDEVRLTLRLPAKLRDRLTEQGKQNGRSLNAEIVSLLERTIGVEEAFGPLKDVVEEIWSAIEKLQTQVARHDEHLFPNSYDDWK